MVTKKCKSKSKNKSKNKTRKIQKGGSTQPKATIYPPDYGSVRSVKKRKYSLKPNIASGDFFINPGYAPTLNRQPSRGVFKSKGYVNIGTNAQNLSSIKSGQTPYYNLASPNKTSGYEYVYPVDQSSLQTRVQPNASTGYTNVLPGTEINLIESPNINSSVITKYGKVMEQLKEQKKMVGGSYGKIVGSNISKDPFLSGEYGHRLTKGQRYVKAYGRRFPRRENSKTDPQISGEYMTVRTGYELTRPERLKLFLEQQQKIQK
jgi:hypothetical protein